MRIISPLEANDWKITDLLTLVLGLQVALWLIIAFDGLVLELPLIRQLVGVLSMLFVPGVLILRILRLHKLGGVEALLYAVGLSIAFDMFFGLIVDVAGVTSTAVSRPLSLLPLVLTTSLSIVALSLIAYVRDRTFNDPTFIHLDRRTLQWSLALCLLPFLSIWGAYAMNSYGSNVISIILYVAVGITLLSVVFSPTFPKALYPIVVFVIALSMLFSTTLISPYIWGWDIQSEYYYATSVVQNGVWDWTATSDYSAMLSVSILPALFAVLGKLDLTTVFKVIYPLLFALTPVGLYALFKRLVDDKRTAFLSTFFIIFSFTFILELPTLARQEIGEFFLVLVLLQLIGMEATSRAKSGLLAIFSFSLIVSHYAVALIFAALFFATWLGLRVIKYNWSRHGRRDLSGAQSRGYHEESLATDTTQPGALRLAFLVAFIAVAFAWYSYMSAGFVWDTVIQKVDFLNQFLIGLPVSKLLGITTAVGVIPTLQGYITVLQRVVIAIVAAIVGSPMLQGYIISQQHELTGLSTALGIKPTVLRFVATALRLLFVLFMTIGLIVAVARRGRTRMNDTYLCLGIATFGMLIATALIPYVSSTLNFTRFYHLSLLVLAPFCVVGGVFAITVVQKRLSVVKKPSVKASLSVIAVLLFISCLFESNVLYETIDHDSGNLALTHLDWGYFNAKEVKGAQWWYTEKDDQVKIYADAFRGLLLISLDGTRESYGTFLGENHVRTFSLNPYLLNQTQFIKIYINATPDNAYVFLGTTNVQTGTLALQERGPFQDYQYVDQSVVLSNRSRVYANGGAQVYFM